MHFSKNWYIPIFQNLILTSAIILVIDFWRNTYFHKTKFIQGCNRNRYSTKTQYFKKKHFKVNKKHEYYS